MTRTIWLASYPKSGNTWFRMLVANLLSEDGKSADINDLPERGGLASAREPFDDILLIESGLLTHDEIDRLRPRVYEELARGVADNTFDDPRDAPPVRFVKAHDAYTLTPDGEPLLAGARGADGAIVIVRDPRDVAPSLANHSGTTIDETIAFMNEGNAALGQKSNRQHRQLPQRVPGWSEHVATWLGQTDIPVHLVRYEDMLADTTGVFARALIFAGRPAPADQIRHAVAGAEFGRLKQQEQEKGFRETPRRNPGGVFFRRGEAGAWRQDLAPEQVARIEAAHAPMMLRLGYALDCTPAQDRAEMGVVA